MVETLAVVAICNAFLKWCTKTFEVFQGQVQAPFSKLSHGFWPSGSTPPDSGFKWCFWCYVVWCCHVLKRDGHTPTTCRNSKTLGVMFHLEPLVPGPRRSVPNGSAQHFMRWTHWLHLSQRLLSTFFKETTSVLLPSDCVFFLVEEAFHHKRANLEPYKDWKRVSKQRQAANTREDIPTMEVEDLQRSHQNRKLHEDFDWRLSQLWWLRLDIPMPRCANVSPVARQVPLPPWTLVAQCRCYSQNAPKNHETRIECNKFHEDKPYEMHRN